MIGDKLVCILECNFRKAVFERVYDEKYSNVANNLFLNFRKTYFITLDS